MSSVRAKTLDIGAFILKIIEMSNYNSVKDCPAHILIYGYSMFKVAKASNIYISMAIYFCSINVYASAIKW